MAVGSHVCARGVCVPFSSSTLLYFPWPGSSWRCGSRVHRPPRLRASPRHRRRLRSLEHPSEDWPSAGRHCSAHRVRPTPPQKSDGNSEKRTSVTSAEQTGWHAPASILVTQERKAPKISIAGPWDGISKRSTERWQVQRTAIPDVAKLRRLGS
jgi:hypothetical protein